jgi:hypothetical protein
MSTSSKLCTPRGVHTPFTLDAIKDRDGAAVSILTGWKCVWTLKKFPGDANALITKSTELTGDDKIEIIDAAFAWETQPADTAALLPEFDYHWFADLTDPDGKTMLPRVGIIEFTHNGQPTPA